MFANVPPKPAIEILADIAERCETMAKAYKPSEPGEPPNPNANEQQYAKWSKKAAKVRAQLAPYLHPEKRINKNPHVSSKPRMTIPDVAEEMFKALLVPGDTALCELWDRLKESEPETAKKTWMAAQRIAVPRAGARAGEIEEAKEKLERFRPGETKPN
jgi:hypothetical protein